MCIYVHVYVYTYVCLLIQCHVNLYYLCACLVSLVRVRMLMKYNVDVCAGAVCVCVLVCSHGIYMLIMEHNVNLCVRIHAQINTLYMCMYVQVHISVHENTCARNVLCPAVQARVFGTCIRVKVMCADNVCSGVHMQMCSSLLYRHIETFVCMMCRYVSSHISVRHTLYIHIYVYICIYTYILV